MTTEPPADMLRPPATGIDAETERPEYPQVTMQLLNDVGLNPFAVKLLIESYRTHPNPIPVKFEMWGVRFAISLAPEAEAERQREAAPTGGRKT